ncbi:pleiotropic drug resistance protein 3-like [Juglans microcarpa x Juglans regia]|uniref:pleiotropic drug resistance protein 3-like n=1 Tax=Juglans microcarpa x Juglans regia TaxID=2249226 RepID=UPI001B7D9A38|nr:pleiotropic drug resistance protein 3-like [Juglans microcarpa x Juglans regia]
MGRSIRSSFQRHTSSFRSSTSGLSSAKGDGDVEYALQWAEIERLPTFERLRSSLFDKDADKGKQVINVTKLGALERQVFVEKLVKQIENDNHHLLQKIRNRIDKVGVKLPTVEVRCRNLRVEAECEVVHGKALPTLWNSLQSTISSVSIQSRQAKISIINDVSSIIKPGRITLLLGPPGCGKTSLLKALSGNLDESLKITGEISYNGYKLEEFVPQKTSAYISQNDVHIPDMTVREILDFSARCMGVGSRTDVLMEVSKREKEAGVVPDPDIDTYMKIIGLDICADTLVGDASRRGISGGQKKRLTTGEMIVGPTKALFMDEITNGLDSSTAFQIVTCLQQLVHITDVTLLVSLLQPAPETFDLFDDLILMSEGKIVYHGPRDYVLEFFEDCGFRCPARKGVADFIQEVISRKDQAQHWYHTGVPHSYIPVDLFSRKFKESPFGKKLEEELSEPYDKSQSHQSALSFSLYSLSKWDLFRACASRELLLMKRNSFIYIFKTSQLIIIACITMTLFLWSRMDIDVYHANYYMGALFYALVIFLVDGIPEISMTIQRLEVFYKQKAFYFYPAWAYAIPASILKIPLSFVESLVWTCFTYYVIGYSPEAQRFFSQLVLLFAVHLSSMSMFRFLASVFQTNNRSLTAGNLAIFFELLFGGFLINKSSMPVWLRWGFWVSPMTYGEIGLSLNEFLAPRWQKMTSANTMIGQEILESRGLDFDGYVFWISLGALFGFTVVFNVGYILALSYLKCKPGVLTALMGVSGAGKTTLLDVLAGRKTSGYIEGQIKIGGYPKVQATFARLSGYCEQTDIHSPQLTVEESVIFSAWLRLSAEVDQKIKAAFVDEVLETIELDEIKDALVGVPGATGLSNEQRKRLTIAVELVANPSIIFMDEPTTSLDARAAAIVMRAVKNVADMGRTIVCTIHQPCIDIFETFDELILLKTGGRMIYSGPLGQHSSRVIEYFEVIPRVPKIRENYNPSMWMLEVTSTSSEVELGVDFAQKYRESPLYENNKELVRQMSSPPPGSTDLHFVSHFSQNGWGQVKSCLWKQHLTYWRNPEYNLTRMVHTLVTALSLGALYWNQGKKLNNQQNLFNIFGSMNATVIFLGTNNCSTVLTYIAAERDVMYRERFAGMYSSWAHSLAQVIVEIPYLFIETVLFVTISYPMIGYYGSAYKVFWYFYAIFCSLLYFNYLGMLVMSLTPNLMVAAILCSAFYTLLNLFSGFLMPEPKIPKWWIWLYYLTPTSWSLNGMLTSQYGDVNKAIMVFGEMKTVAAFLEDYFGFHHDHLAVVAVVLMAFPLVFASMFAYFVGRLNFLRR